MPFHFRGPYFFSLGPPYEAQKKELAGTDFCRRKGGAENFFSPNKFFWLHHNSWARETRGKASRNNHKEENPGAMTGQTSDPPHIIRYKTTDLTARNLRR
jgi:hypothetical protein